MKLRTVYLSLRREGPNPMREHAHVIRAGQSVTEDVSDMLGDVSNMDSLLKLITGLRYINTTLHMQERGH